MLGVRLLRITAWTLLGFGTIWWMLLTFLALAFGASGAGWLLLGGIGVLALPVGVLWLMRDHTPARLIGAGAVTVGMGAALAMWSDLDEIVWGSQELGWVVIVMGFVGATIAAIHSSASIRSTSD